MYCVRFQLCRLIKYVLCRYGRPFIGAVTTWTNIQPRNNGVERVATCWVKIIELISNSSLFRVEPNIDIETVASYRRFLGIGFVIVVIIIIIVVVVVIIDALKARKRSAVPIPESRRFPSQIIFIPPTLGRFLPATSWRESRRRAVTSQWRRRTGTPPCVTWSITSWVRRRWWPTWPCSACCVGSWWTGDCDAVSWLWCYWVRNCWFMDCGWQWGTDSGHRWRYGSVSSSMNLSSNRASHTRIAPFYSPVNNLVFFSATYHIVIIYLPIIFIMLLSLLLRVLPVHLSVCRVRTLKLENRDT